MSDEIEIEDGLCTFLKADVPILAAVTDPLTPSFVRIFPELIPQNVYSEATKIPCLVYTLTGDSRASTWCESDQLTLANFQIDSYARTRKAANALARLVKNALLDYRGMMGAIKVRNSSLTSQFNVLDPEPGLYRRCQLWAFYYDDVG